MTGDTIFRDKAEYVANKLLPAFQTPTGIPYSLISLKSGVSIFCIYHQFNLRDEDSGQLLCMGMALC